MASILIIIMGIIAKLAVREQTSPLVQTLWAITAAAHPVPVFVAIAIPFPTEGDRTEVQHQNGKEKS